MLSVVIVFVVFGLINAMLESNINSPKPIKISFVKLKHIKRVVPNIKEYRSYSKSSISSKAKSGKATSKSDGFEFMKGSVKKYNISESRSLKGHSISTNTIKDNTSNMSKYKYSGNASNIVSTINRGKYSLNIKWGSGGASILSFNMRFPASLSKKGVNEVVKYKIKVSKAGYVISLKAIKPSIFPDVSSVVERSLWNMKFSHSNRVCEGVITLYLKLR